MYRITFDPKLGRWLIQLRSGLFRWETISQPESDEYGLTLPATPMMFANYQEARDHVQLIGLDHVYRDWNSCPKLFSGAPA